MRSHELNDAGGEARQTTLDGARWFRRVRCMRSRGDRVEWRTGADEESAVLVLTGTHDLRAGGGDWASRGVRTTPCEGKPVALYLPPRTPFAAGNGEGEVLLISARRPEPPPRPQTAEPKRKPLLPIAGSNKAYNPATGTWDPIESFPDSTEAIPPRRMPVTELAGGVSVLEVFPFEYKALGLCVAEVVLADGAALELPAPGVLGADRAGYPDEWLVYHRCHDGAMLEAGPVSLALRGEGVACGAADALRIELKQGAGPAYFAVACCGPKLPS